MKTKRAFCIFSEYRSFAVICAAAAVLRLTLLAGSAQTGDYLFSGSEQTITLNPGLYDITVMALKAVNPPSIRTSNSAAASEPKWAPNSTSRH